MGKVTGFLEFDRQEQKYQTASDRIRHFKEFSVSPTEEDIVRQAARCMDCGIPYCHGDQGCPVNNQIPDWNDLVYAGDWRTASRNLHSTNNFPEITGRICPAPCEEACTLNLEDVPVSIKSIEKAIADRAFKEGWIKPEKAARKTGRTVAIIGSGPAGMAAAQQLARAGHTVHVYEREAKAGGLLRYGIPDFKLEKASIDRRIKQMEAEGVTFHYNCDVGTTVCLLHLRDRHDATLICTGAERPRDPHIPGMDLEGAHYAMPYLVQQNKRIGKEANEHAIPILAGGKHVVVVGGGDTASDCIGTAFRQGALSVTQMDIRPMPPLREDKMAFWPYWPTKFRTSTSQAEGAEREFSAATLQVTGDATGRVTGIKCAKVNEKREPLHGSTFHLLADLVLIAIGFSGPLLGTYLENSGLELDERTNIKADTLSYTTNIEGVFAAGDARKGQSLIVWAIREGRQAACSIDLFLMGATTLPR
ncbi:glutamate synthase subunit beta [Flexibacterium corallicola]|uniref:glutamate synthase subunit beta n=1 Tax=Flexibacterium corallicola TaxID=3037259 RepID=UPI00286F9CB6|nr:glutamate synthase subunit beta [Pseudovibrio sp. M1P-2-3]